MSKTISGLKQTHSELSYEAGDPSTDDAMPTATPARFAYSLPPATADAETIVTNLMESSLKWIDVYPQNGSSGWQFSVSGKAWDPETNEFVYVTLTSSGVSVFQKEQDLSLETFGRLLGVIEEALEASLTHTTDE